MMQHHGKTSPMADQPQMAMNQPEQVIVRAEPAATDPIVLRLSTAKGKDPILRATENLQLDASVSHPAHLYCFYQGHAQALVRIHPNRFHTDSHTDPADKVRLPDKHFNIRMEKPNVTEKVLCLATHRDAAPALPSRIYARDLAPIPGVSLHDVLNEFKKIDSLLAYDVVTVKTIP
ncbi:MAG: DUF4384 domain-containing protein [Magnetococcales bacterium]|nr:DUF4384 domain-containing protein [Magnetococcales bacterium]